MERLLKIYNTLTRKTEAVKPETDNLVRIYSCGPTVYDYAHIGNLRKYIFDDLLKRTLLHFGYEVKHVINITDVGHLTSDEDHGEDKIEVGAKREHKSAQEIAKFYEKAFFEDLEKLNILKPDFAPRATENIKEQIELIQTLEKKGFTYKIDDGIYFDTSKLNDYGKLARLNLDELKEGARVLKNPQKKNPSDFALWKFSIPLSLRADAKQSRSRRQMEWPSPWGVGFPGWHIECSAMSTKFLGQPFEIHTGGVDHINTHHTNEIAQSEAACDMPLARYWVHSEFLLENGKKMAKSAGHFNRLKEIEEKGFAPIDFRFLCLQSHYRSKLDFSLRAMVGAREALRKLKIAARNSLSLRAQRGNLIDKFDDALADDLNSPKALAVVFESISEDKFGRDLAEAVDKVFALKLFEKESIPAEIQRLAEERLRFRQEGKFEESDKLRDKIVSQGWRIEDTKEGHRVTIK